MADGRVPEKIEYIPVVDEVEAEADDESSEQEDEEIVTACTGTVIVMAIQESDIMMLAK